MDLLKADRISTSSSASLDAIAVVDFGSQYAHLIANRIRRLNVYSEILLPETPINVFKKYKGIILSGGPQSVYAKDAPSIDPRIFDLGIPILGLCYGHQLITHLLGGEVRQGRAKEYGLATLQLLQKGSKNMIFAPFIKDPQVWMSHGDTVNKLPTGFIQVGQTADCPFAAIAHLNKKIYAMQFHIEVKHTPKGIEALDAFLKLTKVKRTWSVEQYMQQKMAQIKSQIGLRNVFMLVSGGVDSTVAYVLLSKILGTDRVYGLFIDTGLLRKDEAKKTEQLLRKIGIKNFHVHNASREFLSRLKHSIDPEEKRSIIGKTFLKVQAMVAKRLTLNPADWMLGQGTIYPDTIESKGTKHADKIKTHHNRVPEILQMIKEDRIIEPLAELYKDEVRVLGTQLGLPKEAVWKHPFPGPGLGVRILCSNGKPILPPNYISEERAIEKYLAPFGLACAIAPIQSVGVGGDERSYKNPLFIWGKKRSMSELEKLSTYITNHFFVVNRVCLLSSKDSIKKMSVQRGFLSNGRIALTQKLDDIVMTFAEKNKIMNKVWQFPTVLIPLTVNGIKKDAVVLRPICSDDVMTANFYKMPYPMLAKLTKLLQPYVSAILLDITNKPPGTVEWE